MTLREICELTGVSRRAIQGYEKGGLVFPLGKNNRGHLIYDGRFCSRHDRDILCDSTAYIVCSHKNIECFHGN